MKGRFTINPFPELVLSPADTDHLSGLASSLVDSNMVKYEEFLHKEKGKVNTDQWKHFKHKENTDVYTERNDDASSSSSSAGLPSLLCVGTTVGEMEDMMYGVINPTLEDMRIKASYVDDLSGAAVLANVVDPSFEAPFQSLVVKWMEIDIPLQSVGLVRNRDYVYVEATGIVRMANGEKVGYHVLHSVNFPQTHSLPGRVRGNMSICGFFRQVRPNAVEIYVTGLMNPGGEVIHMLVIPGMAHTFLSTLKYAHCGQMKKLAYMLEKRYAEAKELGTPNKENICVACSTAITNRRLGDFGKSSSACRLCFGFLCHKCKILKKLSFVTPDLLLARRNVTFCAVCLKDATNVPAVDAARAQIRTTTNATKSYQQFSSASTTSSSSEYTVYD